MISYAVFGYFSLKGASMPSIPLKITCFTSKASTFSWLRPAQCCNTCRLGYSAPELARTCPLNLSQEIVGMSAKSKQYCQGGSYLCWADRFVIVPSLSPLNWWGIPALITASSAMLSALIEVGVHALLPRSHERQFSMLATSSHWHGTSRR